MLIDGVEIPPLVERLRRHAPFAGRRETALEEVITQIHRVVLRHQVRRGLHVGIGQLVAVAHQRRQLTDDAVDLFQTGRFAVHEELMALRTDANVEERFEMLEVLVVGAEQGFNPLFGDRNALHLYGVWPVISLYYNELAELL